MRPPRHPPRPRLSNKQTGGTTTRFFLQGQPGYEYFKLATPRLVQPSPSATSSRPLRPRELQPIVAGQPSVSINDLVVNVETANASALDLHPRAIFEMHGSGSIGQTVAAILKMRAAPAFVRRGCDAFAFVSVREPLQFLLSNLHDSFQHSFYRHRFVQHTRPETEYFQPSWHGRLSDVAAEVADAQLKTLLKYTGRRAAQHDGVPGGAALERALALLEQIDIIGITHRGDELFSQLVSRLGLQKVQFEIVGSNSARVRKAHEAFPSWKTEERRLFGQAANRSALDQRLYTHALRLSEARLQRLPGGRAHLECQARELTRINAARRERAGASHTVPKRGPKVRQPELRRLPSIGKQRPASLGRGFLRPPGHQRLPHAGGGRGAFAPEAAGGGALRQGGAEVRHTPGRRLWQRPHRPRTASAAESRMSDADASLPRVARGGNAVDRPGPRRAAPLPRRQHPERNIGRALAAAMVGEGTAAVAVASWDDAD